MAIQPYPRRRAGFRRAGLFFGILLLLWVPLSALSAPYAALVMDARTGEVLFARNHDTPLHPASLTKMMTLYVAFEAVQNGEIGLDTMVTVSARAAGQPPSKLGLRAGQRIALRHLIRAAAIRSANDAAVAIAEAISGSEAAFAQRMTRTARAIGMNNTTFLNSHGLTQAGHMSTARDMTILGRQLFFDYPQYYNIFSRRSTDAGVAQVLNTNRRFLDAYRGADGIKTGYTRAAGFNLTGSAERGGKRIIATVFGGTSVAHRNAEMARLLDLGFSRVPEQVAARRPARPAYQGNRALAAAEPQAGAARTVRLQTTVARSPIPPARAIPATAEPPEEVLIAVQDSIESVLADVVAEVAAQPEAPEEITAPVLAAVPLPPARPAELAALASASDDADDAAADTPSLLAQAEVPEDVTVAEGATDEAATETTLAEAVEDPETDMPGLRVAGVVALPTPGTDRPDTRTDSATTAPAQRPDLLDAAREIVLTSSQPAPATATEVAPVAVASAPPPAPETVRRTVSTSDPRVWGVHVGRFPSSFEAERAIVQTALLELATLDATMGRVQARGGGFEVNFFGLTQDQADVACRRLQAQDRLCFTLAP